MNFPFYLAKRITLTGKRTFSKLIVGVAIGTIAVGLSAMILTLAILNGFKGEVTSKQRGFFGDILLTKNDINASYELAPFVLPAEQKNLILEQKGVVALQPFATKTGIITVQQEVEGVVLKGIDDQYDQRYLQKALIEGELLDFTDPAKSISQVLISRRTANRLQLSVGDDFVMYFVQEPLRLRKLVIQGIYHTGSEELDQLYVLGSMDLIRRLNEWDSNQVGGYELMIHDFKQLSAIQEALDTQLSMDLQTTSIRQTMPEVFQWLDLLDANPQVIFVLMLVVAVINMISALLILILERTQMIGILKALGFSEHGLRKVFLYQAAYLLGIGLLIGNALALALYYFQKTTQFIRLDEASYYVSYVPVQIGWAEVAGLNAVLIVLTLVVVLVPNYLIGKIQPIKAIQFK